MTYAQMRTRVAQILGLSGSTAEGAEDWDLTGQAINEAVIDLLSRTRLNVRSARFTGAAGSDMYEVPDGVLRMHDFRTLAGERMIEVSSSDIGRSGHGSFTVVGHNAIRLGWLAEPGLEFLFDYTPYPTPMTADGDDPSTLTFGNVPDEFHQALVDYACWRLADIAADAGSGRGELYRVRYEGKEGFGDPGSWIGRIRMDTNRRVGGLKRKRMRAGGQILVGDATPNYWVG